MKRFAYLFAIILSISSCKSWYYQIATLSSNNASLDASSRMVFTEGDYSLVYDFWTESGQVSFKFENNSDVDVYVDLKRSFFLINGVTYDYFQNRSWTQSQSSYNGATATVGGASFSYPGIKGSVSNSTGSSSASAVEYKEKEGVWVPAHTCRYFNEFTLLGSPYRECGFDRFPSHTTELNFTEETSPYKYNNVLKLVVGNEELTLNSSFYIRNLTNASENTIVFYDYPRNCKGDKMGYLVRYIKNGGPNKFYNKYFTDMTGDDKDGRSKESSTSAPTQTTAPSTLTSSSAKATTTLKLTESKTETMTEADAKTEDKSEVKTEVKLMQETPQPTVTGSPITLTTSEPRIETSVGPYSVVTIIYASNTYNYTTITLGGATQYPPKDNVKILRDGNFINCYSRRSNQYLFKGDLELPFKLIITGDRPGVIIFE